MARLCHFCSSLNLQRSDFTSPPWLPEERRNVDVCTRTFASLRESRSACELCNLIWYALDKSDSKALSSGQDSDIWSLQWAQNTYDWQPDDETEGVEDKFGSALYPCFEGVRQDYGIQLIDDADTDGFLRGRLVGEELDVDLMRKWMDRCKTQHAWRCERTFLTPRKIEATDLAWLTVIDVEDMCLRDLSMSELVTDMTDMVKPWAGRYVALSYVWGSSNNVLTLRSNEAQFRNSGGLDMKLPLTIRHAMEVTKALSHRYLWVDSLCIVQDDDSTKQALMDVMDAIYSSADLTIVAGTGTGANSGLSGWSDRSERSQHLAVVDDDLRVGILPYYQRELLDSHHSQRAWTYQETCLSPRCLIFLNGSIYFNCSVGVFSEQVHAEVAGVYPESSANTLGKDDQAQYILQGWTQHVHSYTRRSLTYQLDGLNAFKGLIRAAPLTLIVDESLYAMPASCFDWAILFAGTGSLIRRPEFPSWSWVGWQGEVQMSLPTHSRYDQMWLLQGTWIDWYRVSSVEGTCDAITSKWGDFFRRAREIVEALDHGQAIRDTANDPKAVDSENESDGEGENEAPVYARSPDDPFGRRLHPEAMRLIPARPGAAYKQTSCSPRDSRLLCFAAPFVSVQTTTRRNPSRMDSEATLSLIDRLGRVCGSISVASEAGSTSVSTVKLLLLSVTAYGDLSQYHASGLTGEIFREYEAEDDVGEYIEEGPEGLDYFKFLNVMYIEATRRTVTLHTGGNDKQAVVHERAGLGFIYREALRHVGEISWDGFVLR
ncbi:uncharacterized protein CLAFUR5_09102 [Fulvia fulva]|uniref:Heterokaryon incompatibility domain-containing protein n=1 Tax=Passalora fulva TaxID=5499 RepID=A0A9Q8UTF3_PASFU|nr:uncharacterized protein CLAFUR5_09102 [Fulvia fulva]UJO21758.1 hypothetical protein CLAFUR5_09102 [Fulvia fulva]